MPPVGRHVADHTRVHRRACPPAGPALSPGARLVCSAAWISPRTSTSRSSSPTRRRDHDGALPCRRSRGHDQARPHAGERGRPGRRARDPRAARRRAPGTRCSARSTATRPGSRRPTPSSAGSSTRSTAPRATCAGMPVWATLIGARARGRARGRRRVGARAARALVGRARARRVPRRRADPGLVGRRARRRAALVRRGTPRSASTRTASATKMMALAHRCWRTRGLGDFWQHMLVAEGAFDIAIDPIVALLGHRRARCRSSRRPAGGGARVDGARRRRAPAASCAPTAACTTRVLARAPRRVGCPPMAVERHRRHRHRHVVGEGDRRRRRRQRRRALAHPARLLACRARNGSSTTRAVAWHDGPARRARSARRRRRRVRSRSRRWCRRSRRSTTRASRARPGCSTATSAGIRRQRSDQPERGEFARFLALAGARAARRARLLDGAGGRQPRAVAARPSISMIVAAHRVRRCSTGTAGTPTARRDVRRARRPDARDLRRPARPAGEVTGTTGCVLEGGTIDAFAEQLVAGATTTATCS